MLKSNFKKITLIMLLLISLIMPIVHAENTEATATQANPSDIQTIAEGQAAADQNAENSIKKGDVYLTGDNVTIDYIVDGNLFVLANTVTIKSQIGGDAFICANKLDVTEQGYVFSNLFVSAKEVNVAGVVYDLYASSKNVNISGYVYRDIRVASDILNVEGVVGRNAFVSATTINFPEKSDNNSQVTGKGSIGGDLNYSAKSEIQIPDGSVTGNVNYSPIKATGASIQSYILGLGKFIVTVIVLWLLYLWLAPKFLEKIDKKLLPKKLLPVITSGILTPIIFIVAFALLIVLGLTSNIALIATLVFTLAVMLSTSTFVIAINNLICNKLKITKKSVTIGILIICSTVMWLLNLIPVAGMIFYIISVIIGLGIIVNSVFDKK